MFVGGVLEEGRRLGGLEESLSANLALNAHGFLVALGLRLGGLLVLRVALALHVCLGSVAHFCGI